MPTPIPQMPLPTQGKNRILFLVLPIVALLVLVAGGIWVWQRGWPWQTASNTTDNTNTASQLEESSDEAPPLKVTTIPDQDGDGLTDSEETRLGTDPAKADTDGDALSDRDESAYRTDPKNPDTDADGFSDGSEISRGFNPLGSGSLLDLQKAIQSQNTNN